MRPSELLDIYRSIYAQHAAYLFVDGLTIVRLQQPEGYAALLNSDPIHNFRLYLSKNAVEAHDPAEGRLGSTTRDQRRACRH